MNPRHLFRYHTSRPPRSHRYYHYSLHEQISECLYHIYENLWLQKIECYFQLKSITELPEEFELGNSTKFWQIDGTYKDGLQKYMENAKETHFTYHSNRFFLVLNICHRSVEWVESFLKKLLKGGGGNHLKSQWFLCCVCTNWITS